jgi:hypothetical protein
LELEFYTWVRCLKLEVHMKLRTKNIQNCQQELLWTAGEDSWLLHVPRDGSMPRFWSSLICWESEHGRHQQSVQQSSQGFSSRPYLFRSRVLKE